MRKECTRGLNRTYRVYNIVRLTISIDKLLLVDMLIIINLAIERIITDLINSRYTPSYLLVLIDELYTYKLVSIYYLFSGVNYSY
jgi:hypothetical protein